MGRPRRQRLGARIRRRRARTPGRCDRCRQRYEQGATVASINGGPWICLGHLPAGLR